MRRKKRLWTVSNPAPGQQGWAAAAYTKSEARAAYKSHFGPIPAGTVFFDFADAD